ncbi:MAG: heavy metal translocating P-type ATPase [Aquirufa sp.]
MYTEVLEEVICYHCGDECSETPIIHQEKTFCCHGCEQVYELLNDHHLDAYYTCDLNPGISPTDKNFDFLNNKAFRDRLITFSNADFSKVSFHLPAIHCRSCLYLLENLQKLNPQIIKTSLNFGKKDLTVWFKEDQLSLGALATLIARLGYEPHISNAEEKPQNNDQKKLFLKLGIAGFCAGNAMLFSFPEYLGIEDGSLQQLFGYLNLALGSVAVFYSGSDYFSNVYAHLKLRKMTIELPILLGILVGYGRSVFEILSHTGAGYIDSVSGLIFFLLIGKWFQQKSFDFLSFERNYKAYFPLVVTKIANGKEETAPLEEIQVGDRLLIRNQEIIPADAYLLKGKSEMDYSFVTGESELIPIQAGQSIYAGGKHVGEAIEIQISKELNQSHLTQLWEQKAFKDPNHKTENWENFANKVGMYFTVILLGLATAAGIYWYNVDSSRWSNAVVSILVIACPCALAVSYPFALGHGIRWLAKFNFFIKDIQTFERMAQVDTLVFDKTGTLTLQSQQEPTVHFNRELSDMEWNAIFTLVYQSTHPLSKQAKKFLQFRSLIAFCEFKERNGKGLEALFNGVLIQIGSAKYTLNKLRIPEGFISSETRLFVSINQEPIGFIEFPWENRPGVEGMLHRLRHQYEVHLISGDKKEHAAHLLDWFEDQDHVKFECSPLEKMEYIQALQKQGKIVAMIGDGLNDAGALKQASVGIAVSDDHLHFTPSSDAIIQGAALPRLGEFLRYAKFGLKLIKASFLLSLVYNGFGLSYAIQGTLYPLIAAILMPINSLSMLLIATWGMNGKGQLLTRSKIRIKAE